MVECQHGENANQQQVVKFLFFLFFGVIPIFSYFFFKENLLFVYFLVHTAQRNMLGLNIHSDINLESVSTVVFKLKFLLR